MIRAEVMNTFKFVKVMHRILQTFSGHRVLAGNWVAGGCRRRQNSESLLVE